MATTAPAATLFFPCAAPVTQFRDITATLVTNATLYFQCPSFSGLQ
jgi:hypothetical protein